MRRNNSDVLAILIDGAGAQPAPGTPPGGETDEIRAARDLAGDGDRVVSGRIHEHQARRRHRRRIFVNRTQRAGAALGDGAERFFQNRGDAAVPIAGRRIVVERAAVPPRVVPPPIQQFDQPRRHRGIRRAVEQQAFSAVDFRGLGKNDGAAFGHQLIGGEPDGGVCRDGWKTRRTRRIACQTTKCRAETRRRCAAVCGSIARSWPRRWRRRWRRRCRLPAGSPAPPAGRRPPARRRRGNRRTDCPRNQARRRARRRHWDGSHSRRASDAASPCPARPRARCSRVGG